MIMPLFTYPALPAEPNTTRMIRLLPHYDRDAIIKCKHFNYVLSERGSAEHLYEALSYVWGNGEDGIFRSQRIELDNHTFFVTPNLHAALVNLRNHQLDRVLWIDAICINQEAEWEKTMQIPLMRKIYSQAHRVIVWLGYAFDNGDIALESIRLLAEGKSRKERLLGAQSSKPIHQACANLLQRKWFRRIWVLQEVGVARCISIMCGSVQISGHAFCEGIDELDFSSLLLRIYPVLHLISDATFRSKNELDSNRRPLMGELLDMYRFHDSSDYHDKIYALLGLSADGPSTHALKPNYSLSWSQVLKQLITYILSPELSVQAWPDTETVMIKGKGQVLGHVVVIKDHLPRNNLQLIRVLLYRNPLSLDYEDWIVRLPAEPIQEGDIVYILQGALNPSIIRMCRGYFIIIATTVIPKRQKEENMTLNPELHREEQSINSSIYDVVLVWKLPLHEAKSNPTFRDREVHADEMMGYQEEPLERMNRLVKMTGNRNDCIFEEVTKAAARDERYGPKIMDIFLQRQGDTLSISDQVVKAAAGNERYGLELIVTLLQRQGDVLSISNETVKVAARDERYRPQIMQAFFLRQGATLLISDEVVKMAAGNERYGLELMQILFQRHGNALPISEKVVEAAAKNTEFGTEVMEMLFLHCGEELPISEEVVKAAARNGWRGYNIMGILFKHRRETVIISEEVVKAAAENNWWHGPAIMELFFEHQGKALPISENVVEADCKE
ncbi:heterokaryon incompatibility protein-domain-containing protein [Aspergillus ambiguus]|uniref:HET domain-containing protein n=1 Tax=Aspergillus ambiguus TaxID=176160 RepID=UPI003CCCEB5A